MRAPIALLLISLCGLVATALVPGQFDWLLLTVPCVFASLLLLLWAWRKNRRPAGDWVILDGSNVMHWRDGEPDLATVRDVLSKLTAEGLKACVVFDANAGYKIADRYMNDRSFAQALGLPVNRVLVAPKGTPADPLILSSATDLNARIVTNDRFRDWAAEYSGVVQTNLVKGGYRRGALWLSL